MDYAEVAHLYDSYVQTDLDIAFFLQEARGCRSVLELMCGTGRLSIPLIEAGVPLSCLDSSTEMLAVLDEKLRARGITAPTHLADATGFSVGERFDLIVIPFNSFSELLEPEEQGGCLHAVREHLADDGRFVCTMHNPTIRLARIDDRSHSLGTFSLADGHVTVSAQERHNPAAGLVTGTQTYVLENSEGRSEFSLPLQFRLHDRDGFETLARERRFEIDALYGDYDRSPFDPDTSPFMIWRLVAS
jgi:SAM-dependent methyltransferase